MPLAPLVRHHAGFMRGAAATTGLYSLLLLGGTLLGAVVLALSGLATPSGMTSALARLVTRVSLVEALCISCFVVLTVSIKAIPAPTYSRNAHLLSRAFQWSMVGIAAVVYVLPAFDLLAELMWTEARSWIPSYCVMALSGCACISVLETPSDASDAVQARQIASAASFLALAALVMRLGTVFP